jgi:hypothetical protein
MGVRSSVDGEVTKPSVSVLRKATMSSSSLLVKSRLPNCEVLSQFTGPVQIAPAVDKVMYLLVVHWASEDHFNAWKSSSSYRALQSLGDVSSELFVPIVETRPREHLRDDKLQRDWEWTQQDRR